MESMSKTNVKLRQTMVSFAYLAYIGEGITFNDPNESILNSINKALPQIVLSENSNETLADWEVVWGPVAYTVPGGMFQNNMTYIVKKKGTSDYVIALRGTNFMSQVDWFLEDFEIINTMPWPLNSKPTNPIGQEISESTSIDMNIQINKLVTVDKNGLGVLDFLNQETDNNPINICVTGHSLGGVLSNTLALYLLQNPSWDKSEKSTVSCISFAAPAAGNEQYAQNAISAFEKAFQKGSFPGWDSDNVKTNLDNVRCNLDVIPLTPMGKNVYSGDDAGRMFEIYAIKNNPSNNIDFNELDIVINKEWSLIKSMLLKPVGDKLAKNNYTQLEPTPPIIGTFEGNTNKLSDYSSFSIAPLLEGFAAQAAWQHSNSYGMYFNVPTLFDPTIINRNDDASHDIPYIDSITPDNAHQGFISDKTKVTIKGKNFAKGIYSNFLIFSDPSNPIHYVITSVTENEIKATFDLDDANSKGTQEMFIYHGSPFYKSNAIKFTVA